MREFDPMTLMYYKQVDERESGLNHFFLLQIVRRLGWESDHSAPNVINSMVQSEQDERIHPYKKVNEIK